MYCYRRPSAGAKVLEALGKCRILDVAHFQSIVQPRENRPQDLEGVTLGFDLVVFRVYKTVDKEQIQTEVDPPVAARVRLLNDSENGVLDIPQLVQPQDIVLYDCTDVRNMRDDVFNSVVYLS